MFKVKPHLFWSTRNQKHLSFETLTEGVLNYGNWQDFLSLKKKFGLKRLKKVFRYLTSQKRVNLRPETVNYFKNYFEKYAS